jgi:hypothetical protein
MILNDYMLLDNSCPSYTVPHVIIIYNVNIVPIFKITLSLGFSWIVHLGILSQVIIEHVSFPLFDTPSCKYRQLINFCVYVCKEFNDLFPLLLNLNLCTFVSDNLTCYKILQQIFYLDFVFLLACCPSIGLYMLLSSTSLWNLQVFQLSSNNLTLVSFL